MNRYRTAPARRRAACLALAACTAACAPTAKPDDEAAGGTPAAASSTSSPAGTGPYDPRTDPLVNPREVFEPAPSDPAAIADGDTLYRTLEGNPANLNPLFIAATVEFYFASTLFTDGLFTFDKDLKWKVNDDWVESFEESPDHLVYTVRLRPGLKHHDGQPLTAEDVRWTFEQIMDERVPCPAVKTGKDRIAKVEALDARTVRITHKDALATSKWNAGWGVLPKHVYAKDKQANPDLKSGDYYVRLNRAPIGNGPYRFVEWVENEKIVIERWEDYPGRKPHYKRMVFRIIPERNVMLLSFTRGDIDEFRMEAKQFATQTGAGSDFAKVGHKLWWPEWSYSYISWNQVGNPFFADRNVRLAMSHACDLPRMIRDLSYNLFGRATGPFHPDSWMYRKGLEPIRFDLDQAGKLLDAAGWTIDEGREGWRYKTIDGKPIKFEFTLLIPQGAQISIDMAAIYQQDLRSIGVDMKTQVIEWATFLERCRKHEYHASIANYGTGVDPYTLRNIYHSAECVPDGSSGRNYGCYKNPAVDALFDQGLLEFDPDKRAAIYQQIHQHLYDDQPNTFLWHRGTLWALNRRLRGLSAGPRGIFNFDPAERAWWTPRSLAPIATDQKL